MYDVIIKSMALYMLRIDGWGEWGVASIAAQYYAAMCVFSWSIAIARPGIHAFSMFLTCMLRNT